MFSQRIKQVMQAEQLLTAAPSTTVLDACSSMARDRLSAVVVVQDGLVTGIFTERDAVQRVIAEGRDPRGTLLADVMTPRPVTVHPDKSFGHALALMHERGIRHVPVAVDGKPVGIVSARDALDPELEEFVCEASRREAML
ncbi:MAG: CBS domain-containing protein [Burkholderiales bacterium]|nr:CBS domain-containing protein [Burkholderiales bacterium]